MERVYALTTRIGESGGTGTPFSPAGTFKDIGSLVSTITSNAFVLAGLLAFVFIIVGGFAIIMGAGSGDPKRMEQGRKTLTMAVAGLLIIIFSFWIVRLVGLLLGVDPLKLYQ